MKLRKFPVTAPDGTEYEAVIERGSGGFGALTLNFRVYERRVTRGIFGKVRVKRVCVADNTYFELDVTDVIGEVCGIVSLVEERKAVVARREMAYAAFNAWDGRIAK